MAITASEQNYAGEKTPRLIADEYLNCNFSFKTPLMKDGKAVGHPLDVPAKFVECNLVNREPHQDAVLIQCNTAIVDTEIQARELIDHKPEIEKSDLPLDVKTELLKTTPMESRRTITREHKIHGRFNHKTRQYEYRKAVREIG